MVLSLRSDDLTYNPGFSTINCDKAECLAPVAHVQSYSSKSQVLVPQLLVWEFFCHFFHFHYVGWAWMDWLSFVGGRGVRKSGGGGDCKM